MKFKKNYLSNYLNNAPVALAIERALECQILSSRRFARPILDAGCGDGLFASILFDEPVDTGIDRQPQELKIAQYRAMYRELICCSADQVPRQSGFYKTILANSTLEHIKESDRTLREWYRLLDDEGRLYVTVPTEKFQQYTWIAQLLAWSGLQGFSAKYQRCFNRFWKHYHCYSIEEWRQRFKSSGFDIVQTHTYASKRICLLNDFMLIFAVPSKWIKCVWGRWVLSPRLRRILLVPLYGMIKTMIDGSEKEESGAIVFFALKKIK